MFRWLGYLDSNQGITVSETVVLPLDYSPMARYKFSHELTFCQQKVQVYEQIILF